MKKQILLCLLIATIIFTGCKKDEPVIPIDPSAFVGKWIGQVTLTLLTSKQMTLDTIALGINPNNKTQIIDTFSNNNVIYTFTDSKNYTKVDVPLNGLINGVPALITIANVKGVLSNPTTIEETGDLLVKLSGQDFKGSYNTTYTKR